MRIRKFLIFLISFLILTLCGAVYSSWTNVSIKYTDKEIHLSITTWNFVPDSAILENISNCNYLTASREYNILSANIGDTEAVRLTNTAGTQTKDHSFIVSLDREYTVGEAKIYKIEFDYYHIEKRQQQGKGYPKVQLTYNGSGKGNTQGGGETVNDKAPFIATNMDANWWHLEYFISALCPTLADHGDTGINPNQKINGVKIIDSAIYDFTNDPAFIVIDNLRLSSEPASRLGFFNKGTSFKVGNYYWVKVAWCGDLHQVNITFDDDTIAEYTPSNKSPFYIRGLAVGTVVITVIIECGDNHTVLTIQNTLTVTT